jgi:hypothetical protein
MCGVGEGASAEGVGHRHCDGRPLADARSDWERGGCVAALALLIA